jgi:glycosyltransferase involved in cell wall biosynthesis
LILTKFPGARLRLAGDTGKRSFEGQNIDVLGWVADMETEMAGWSLAIVPIRIGGGTRIKILEAFSRKCPVVSTSRGAYGHDVKDGKELLIADSPEDFTESCLRILTDPAKGINLAENAWRKFLQDGTWDSQAECITQILQKIWGKSVNVESSNSTYDVQIHSQIRPPTANEPGTHANIVRVNDPVPQVSVVIPAYNRANCVACAVESALAQTFRDFEIIVIDDGSSDNTTEILKQFGDKIRLIRQENRGVSAARNTGIHFARGKWIAFLDSDDYWHPEKLERQLKALEKYSAKISFTRCVNGQNESLRDIEYIFATLCEPEIYSVQNAVDSVCLSPRHPMIQTMVAEKKLLEKAGFFDETFRAAEDAELLFRLSFLSGFIYIDRPLTTIFENSTNSLTYSEKLEPMARRNQSYLRLQGQMYWRLAEISPEKVSVIRKRLGYFISRRAEIACASGELHVARTLARDGIFYAGNLRDFARCAGILLVPKLVRTRAQKKWPV